MLANEQLWFQANLKSETGELLAEGKARVFVEERAVNFVSDFVPLIPIGVAMEIVRIESGAEVHRFIGRVYLSDKTLLRLVSVDDELLPGSEYVYCGSLPFSAVLAPCPEPAPKRRAFWRRGVAPRANLEEITVPIIELTDRQLVFLFDNCRPFETGQRFILKANMPLLIPETTIQIVRSMLFGVNASYLCELIGLSHEAHEALRYFLYQYSLKRNKLF